MSLADVFQSSPGLLIGGAFVLSLLIGSFLNVVIHRLPIMLDRQWRDHARELVAPDADSAVKTESLPEGPFNLLVPRSRCPHCHAEIKAHQNIPILSYLLLGGKCAHCKARISPRYPIVELGTAVLSAAVVWHFGWHWQTLAALVLTWALIALTVIDLDHQLLPDIITLPLLWLGLLLSLAWHAGLTPPAPTDPRSAILGAAAGYLSLWLVSWVFKLITGKEGMGYGDFKLLAAIGAFLGWKMLPAVILLSSLVGATVGILLIVLAGRGRHIPIPFGPYLAAAGLIALFWGETVNRTYLQFL